MEAQALRLNPCRTAVLTRHLWGGRIQVLRTSRRAIRILVPRDEVAGLVRNILPNALCNADVGGRPVLSPNSAPNWGARFDDLGGRP